MQRGKLFGIRFSAVFTVLFLFLNSKFGSKSLLFNQFKIDGNQITFRFTIVLYYKLQRNIVHLHINCHQHNTIVIECSLCQLEDLLLLEYYSESRSCFNVRLTNYAARISELASSNFPRTSSLRLTKRLLAFRTSNY